jgi:hypothetical protein
LSQFLHSIAAGAIYTAEPGGKVSKFVGSCGAFLQRDIFLTAAHCAPANHDLVILTGLNSSDAQTVTNRVYHPTYDLALLRATKTMPIVIPGVTEDALAINTFQEPSFLFIEGGDFMCFGFPAEGSPDNVPTGRTIRGHIQRWFPYTDQQDRSYLAIEMSCPAPQGLSGSLISYVQDPRKVIGVVTGNLDSYAIVDSISDVDDNGRLYREETRRLISYGIAASLGGQQEWLTESVRTLESHASD